MQKTFLKKTYFPKSIIKNSRIAVITSRYNKEISDNLEKYCLKTLKELGANKNNIHAFHVPGALEIPVLAKLLCQKKKYHAIIALGAIIKGKTYHFNLVCENSARGCLKVAVEFGIPIIYEVLACYNIQQAKERSRNNSNNKGIEAAQSALAMIKIIRGLKLKN